MQKKLIIASNRLPFKIEKRNQKYELITSSGGLVSALKSLIENYKDQYKITWVGTADFTRQMWYDNQDLFANVGFDVQPVFITDKKTEKAYYDGLSNSTIWPLFHYFPSFAEFHEQHFEAYKKVNSLFEAEIVKICKPGDVVWVHDYHLMTLPGQLKTINPELQVGFFLHIPFPSYEIFRLLPERWREELLNNLIKADLVGFQTKEYANHFLGTVAYILGIENDQGKIYRNGHLCQVGDYPISIDYAKFNEAFDSPVVKKARISLLEKYKGVRLIFSVDRLDYTKGVINRLNALEKLFEDHPVYKEKVIFILNVIPSRDGITKYTQRKTMIEESIGRINGKYGNVHWQPIIYQYRHLNFNQLLTFYTTCDVALVTPLRDGMNLVAKEFIASRKDTKGVLVLSEMAGAVNELDLSVIVNPTDLVKLKDALIESLEMPESEQVRRMEVMQRIVLNNTINHWLNGFLKDCNEIYLANKSLHANALSFEAKNKIMLNYQQSKSRLILLDYDGTLTEFTRLPEHAKPKENLLNLLQRLGANSKNNLCVISGRRSSDLEAWFGNHNLTLVAEHGGSFKLTNSSEWIQIKNVDISWKPSVKEVLEKQLLIYPDSFVEEKEYSVAWHYRAVNAELDEKLFIDLNKKLTAINTNNLFKILQGNKVLEIKCATINKGQAAHKLLSTGKYDFVMAIGDDRTDEDMFEVLNEAAHVTIKVGLDKTKAKYNFIGTNNVLSFLSQMSELN
ncbi:bifunctional alpha,alpha-trehalose-phosphate synthase (UDP-forming)/trehalose-phosphatase [Sphingobacteriaceae bacterium]|nr:bifunctional alpha,alpha-trehalose-phosphate synthase (UDP-forming)/trehalose-phosphatase [Sphingobacteriaceae bacterium]